MKIVILRTWITNIGNGFIDKGCRAALERAKPEADIVEVSGYPNFAADEKARGDIGDLFSKLFDISVFDKPENPQALQNVVNMSELHDADLAVLPGCVLTSHALRKYTPTLRDLHKRDIPIILVGAGGGVYTDDMQQYVREKFSEFQPTALLTRDAKAYECYSQSVEYSYEGIDCAYFINDWYEPPSLNEDLIALTFDKHKEPNLNRSKQKIRPHHAPFGWPFQGVTKSMFRPEGRIFNPKSLYIGLLRDVLNRPFDKNFFDDPNSFFSDNLKEYLMIYGNVEETHSDRVHACLPTMVYGGQAKFYHSTPRAGLFDQVTDGNIKDELTGIDPEKLEKMKDRQLTALKEAIETAI